MLTTGSRQLVEQCLCFFEVGRVKAFGKPGVDGCEEVADFGAMALVTAQPGGSSELPSGALPV